MDAHPSQSQPTQSQTTHPPTPEAPALDVPVRRMKFDFTQSPTYWFDGDPARTHLLHALSVLFPEGERFFMDSVIYYRDRIEEPRLKRQIRGFLGQEGQHSAEHRKYNAAIERGRIRVGWIDTALQKGLSLLRRLAPKKMQLAVTCALEHFTAIMANQLLSDPRFSKGMDPAHEALWRWHAIEETEHKAVAYDVYQSVGGGYLTRVSTMIGTTVIFIAVVFGIHLYMLAADGQLHRPRTWRSLIEWNFFRPGLLVRLLPDYVQYYRLGFHPWQQDNSRLIAQWKERYAPGEVALA